MTSEMMESVFENNMPNEFLKYERIAKPLHRRPDMHAFLLLDQLVPGTSDIVSAAEHDEIYLDVEPEQLALVITKEQVIDLIRCGVRFDDGNLRMFA